MSLRSRLLILFAAFTLLPLLGVGLFEYSRSSEAVRRLLIAQTSDVATRVASLVDERFVLAEGDLELLAGNTETARLFSDAPRVDRAYLEQAWLLAGRWYEWASFRDTTGRELLRLGSGAGQSDMNALRLEGSRLMPISRPLLDRASGRAVGTLVVAARLDSIGTRELSDRKFGKSGYTLLVDQPARRIVFDPIADGAERGRAAVIQLSGDGKPTTVMYAERDSDRVASVARVVSRPGMLVLSSSAVDEFATPLNALRAVNLLLVLLAGCSAAIAFWLLSRRVTRPLAALTGAADEIGAGNFTPVLPPRTQDDVGRLIGAFEAMTLHVRQMMDELEASRQMAAVGAFAGQISHEIRNPLTAIKLNLQSLQRDARVGLIPDDSTRTVEICLEEIQRLDRVVRGVLRLGRTSRASRQQISVAAVIESVLQLVRPQLDAHGITIKREVSASADGVLADPEQLSGVFLNVIVNAIEALQSTGGVIEVRTETVLEQGRSVVRVTIADSGPGIAPEFHARIFDPFFSTKAQGTGLGLALAARDVEEHGGRLMLGQPSDRASGCTIIADLPALANEQSA